MARPVTRVACVRRNQESRELASDQAHKLAIDLTKRINRAIYRLHPIRLLDEPVTETNVLGALAVRNLAYMLNPIITGALLGKNIMRRCTPDYRNKRVSTARFFT